MTKALLILVAVVGGVLAIGGGPILGALLIMIAVPFIGLAGLGAAGHAAREHPHFAPPRDRRG